MPTRVDQHDCAIVEFKLDGKRETHRIPRLLGSGDGNTKLRKNARFNFVTRGLSLAPHRSARGNVCSHASPGCISACLDHQGLASVFRSIHVARAARTHAFYDRRIWFLRRLRSDIAAAMIAAAKSDKRLCVRLNVFSDVPWERFGIVDEFPDVEFYDYTKNPNRAGLIRTNYWLTFSRSELNHDDCLRILRTGRNVSVVFADRRMPYTGNRSHLQRLPKTWHGFRVFDGDTSDLRFDDPRGRKRGTVVGLRLKAHSHAERENAIRSGFAVLTGN